MPDKRVNERTSAVVLEPISVRIPDAVRLTGLSRSRIYELIGSGELQIAKDKRCTLVIVASLREVVARRTGMSLANR